MASRVWYDFLQNDSSVMSPKQTFWASHQSKHSEQVSLRLDQNCGLQSVTLYQAKLLTTDAGYRLYHMISHHEHLLLRWAKINLTERAVTIINIVLSPWKHWISNILQKEYEQFSVFNIQLTIQIKYYM